MGRGGARGGQQLVVVVVWGGGRGQKLIVVVVVGGVPAPASAWRGKAGCVCAPSARLRLVETTRFSSTVTVSIQS